MLNKKVTVMTVDELLKSSLVNYALDSNNREMLLSLSEDKYEVTIEEPEPEKLIPHRVDYKTISDSNYEIGCCDFCDRENARLYKSREEYDVCEICLNEEDDGDDEPHTLYCHGCNASSDNWIIYSYRSASGAIPLCGDCADAKREAERRRNAEHGDYYA